jgi:GNAT superfamily N-acetyltransferase
METIRPASEDDASAIFALDQIAQEDSGRREYVRRVIASGACHVGLEDDNVAGYVVFDYTFFGQGFVELLYVARDERRHGVGKALMQYVETLCRTPKLFTSTNLSNQPMQALLARLGYRLSGVIHDLDEGDPELVYVKYLRGHPTR